MSLTDFASVQRWADANNTPTTTVTHRLWGWDENFKAPGVKDCVLACLFGHMAELAAPTMEHYRGDLYRDALWLNKHLDGECMFFYQPRTFGSSIGEELALVRYLHETEPTYAIDLQCDKGYWVAAITTLPGRA